jgi:hypothetical protein
LLLLVLWYCSTVSVLQFLPNPTFHSRMLLLVLWYCSTVYSFDFFEPSLQQLIFRLFTTTSVTSNFRRDVNETHDLLGRYATYIGT